MYILVCDCVLEWTWGKKWKDIWQTVSIVSLGGAVARSEYMLFCNN